MSRSEAEHEDAFENEINVLAPMRNPKNEKASVFERLNESNRSWKESKLNESPTFISSVDKPSFEATYQNSEIIDKNLIKCSVWDCSKSFKSKEKLEVHLWIHQGLRPFVCTFEDCQKTFITKGHLVEH